MLRHRREAGDRIALPFGKCWADAPACIQSSLLSNGETVRPQSVPYETKKKDISGESLQEESVIPACGHVLAKKKKKKRNFFGDVLRDFV